MTARRVYLTPPIGLPNLHCRHCRELIVASAKVVYDNGDPDWFVYQHADGAESCRSVTVAEPFDDTDAYDALEPLYAAQLTEEGGTAAKSAQSARVQDAVDRLFNAERSRREFVEAGDRVSASAAATALRGVIEDLPLHDVRSLALRLFLRAAKAEA